MFGRFFFVDFVQLIFFSGFSLEAKVDSLEQHIEIINNEPIKAILRSAVSQNNQKAPENTPEDLEEIKCKVCEFVKKIKFGLNVEDPLP